MRARSSLQTRPALVATLPLGRRSGVCRFRCPLTARERPGSLTEPAEPAGRSMSNLSRTLKTMSQYGLVELWPGARGTLVPRCRTTR